ncbi:MAG: hypothetical protein M3162_00055 [Thermoproteota archaeon]|nr:hypothetical protein [Thermoproteota archaeon]
MKLCLAINQGLATMVEREDSITGYLAGLGLFGHAVARSNKDLKALIADASSITGPGFFVPGLNHEVINWLLETGFRAG